MSQHREPLRKWQIDCDLRSLTAQHLPYLVACTLPYFGIRQSRSCEHIVCHFRTRSNDNHETTYAMCRTGRNPTSLSSAPLRIVSVNPEPLRSVKCRRYCEITLQSARLHGADVRKGRADLR